MYDEDAEEVWEKFRGRTKLLGTLGQNNCTLEIVKIKDSDHGPFCLQIGILGEIPPHNPTDLHKFVNDCVQFKIIGMLLNILIFIDIFDIFSTYQS